MSHASRPDDGRDDATEPLPAWYRSTPIRPREWWGPPAALVLLAGVFVGIAAVFAHVDGALAVGGLAAAVELACAAVLAVYGRRAYREQEVGASWDLHRARVLVVAATSALCAVAGLVFGVGLLFGIAFVAPATRWLIRGRDAPRFDHVVAVVTAGIVLVAVVVLGVVGLTLPGIVQNGHMAFAGLVVIAPALVVLLVLEIRALVAGRFPRW